MKIYARNAIRMRKSTLYTDINRFKVIYDDTYDQISELRTH